jgi:Transposase DDE domain group 1
MPTDDVDTLLPFSLPSIRQKKVTTAFDGGRISSDGGVVLLAGADKRLGLIDTLTAIIPNHRDPTQIRHTMSDILRAPRVRDRLWLPGCRRPGRSAPRPGLQAGLRPIAEER